MSLLQSKDRLKDIAGQASLRVAITKPTCFMNEIGSNVRIPSRRLFLKI